MDSANAQCSHTGKIKEVTPSGNECDECKVAGTKPVALRLSLSCRHIGCCDSSVEQPAKKHYMQTQHPIIESHKSATPGTKEWRYCYIDSAYL